jgi:hypothetical protein
LAQAALLHKNSPLSAIRCGRYVYIHYWEKALSPAGGRSHELFDLQNDIGQSENILSRMPGVAALMRDMLMQHLRASGCEIPVANPRYGASAGAE